MTFWNKRRGGNDSPAARPPSARRGAVGRTLAALVTVALLGGLWLFFAPTRLGGKTEYVVTYGVSMQPRFHAGDLAIVRARSHYSVGQIVAYKNRELGRVVLHRIIGRIGDRYVFKGDNNNFVDSYHPTRSELIGRLWVRVPRAGRALLWLAAPQHAAFVGGLVFLMTLLLGGSASRRRGRRGGDRVHRRSPVTAGWATALLGTALVTALAFGLLAGVSYSRSTTQTISAPGYAHEGAYTYAAHVSPSALYPSGRLATGQTVFTRLVRRVEIGFSDRLVSALPHSFHGSAQLRLALQSSLGWTVPLPSPPRLPVSGDSVRLTQTLDLRAVEAEISHYLTRTGIATDTFTLTVTPRVDVRGTVSGQPVTSTFEPTPLTFLVDGYALRLAQPAAGGGIPGQTPADPLQPSAAGTVDRVVERTVASSRSRPRRRDGAPDRPRRPRRRGRRWPSSPLRQRSRRRAVATTRRLASAGAGATSSWRSRPRRPGTPSTSRASATSCGSPTTTRRSSSLRPSAGSIATTSSPRASSTATAPPPVGPPTASRGSAPRRRRRRIRNARSRSAPGSGTTAQD